MKKFNHTAHKELWDWLAKNPDKEKDDWKGWDIHGGKYVLDGNCCFACLYDDYTEGRCNDCPLVWAHLSCCSQENSLYKKWERFDEDEEETRAELARQIRDLPVREGVECI